MQTIIKIILAILFICCLFNMPYGYYQAVRFLGMVGFALLAYFSYEQKKNNAVLIYISLALLFQPFIKVALGRTIWNVVDIIVAIGLLSTVIYSKQKKIEN